MEQREMETMVEQAYKRMTRLCSRGEYCVYDIRQKLRGMELPEEGEEAVIQKLVEARFIDEVRYARSFISDKLRFNRWGRKKIKLVLQQKQLPWEIIEQAFTEFSEEELSASLPSLLEKKWATVTGASMYEKEGKLIRFALGRGFGMDEIRRCLAQLKMEREE
ncbi:MAG: regulatory protein RecX [Fermentimonas sp.]|jgi:regulatory protein